MSRALDTMVAQTPARRDRYVDFLRLLAIGVVVVWHWSLSIFSWDGERWVMPNPIYAVPGGWLATWLLQIMPVFFLVGGYANRVAWSAAQRHQRGVRGFYGSRLRRLLVPVGVFVAAWAAVDLVAHLTVPGYPGVLTYGWVLVTPLWFVAAYLWVTMLTPLTATAHARARWLSLGLLASAVAGTDLARFGAGIEGVGWVNTALVWVLIHQLGYFYPSRSDPSHRLVAAGLLLAAVVALAGLTSLVGYPRSMVSTVGQDHSNILPTTVPIALVAVVQLGLILLLRAPVTRWLARRRPWKVVVAGNAMILTIFLWHMTAVLVVLAVLQALAVGLLTEPTAAWWAQRPFWLVAPAPVLVLLVAVFGRFERASASRSRST